jgi:hypothetical protein
VDRRHVGEERHQLGSAQPAAVELEQLGQDARRHPFADGGARSPVPWHAGRIELVLHEAGVRSVAREEDRDAVEAGAGARRVDDRPHRDADLVIGIGGRHHVEAGPGAVRRRWTGVLGHRAAGERLGGGEHVGVGGDVTGEPDDDLDGAALADRAEQLQLQRPQALGQVDDDPRQAIRQIDAGADDRRRQQIPLVVPPGPQRAHHLGGHPRRLPAPFGAGQRGDGAGPGDPQLAVQVAQGDDGRRVVLHTVVQARVGEHDLAHGDVDDGGRHRLATGGMEGRRPEELGEAEHRDHVDGGEPAAASEPPAGHHAGGVGGHHDRDGAQRIATLRGAHGGGQRIERRRPEGGGGDGDGHEGDGTEGVSRRRRLESRSRWSAFGPGRLGCPDGPG